jgi:hypothetical protein
MTSFFGGSIRYPHLSPDGNREIEEPEELEDSEISDAERRQAIARERTRRQGLS